MSNLVTNTQKKAFLDWFLHSFELQRRECHWLLTRLMSDEQLLSRVHFVSKVRPSKRTIIISSTCVNEISFRFSKGRFITTDVTRALHHIRLHPQESIFLKLCYLNCESCPQYSAVEEDDPMERYKISSNNLNSLVAEMILDEAIEKFQQQRLYHEIDRSLAEKDKERFMELSRAWLKICKET